MMKPSPLPLRYHHHCLVSTNDEARRWLETQGSENAGRVVRVTADSQTGGRGRRGRAWSSPLGGLWFSLGIIGEVSESDCIPLLAGLAVCETVEACTGCKNRFTIKWPNDVLLDGKKVAGILCERFDFVRHDDRAEMISALVIGIGINANFPLTALPAETRFPATTLQHVLGDNLALPALADELETRLLLYLNRDRTLTPTAPPCDIEAIQRRLVYRNEPVTLTLASGQVLSGVLRGIDENGHLLLDVDGHSITCVSGKVAAARPAEVSA